MTAVYLPPDVRYPCTILSLLVPSVADKPGTGSRGNLKQDSPRVSRTTPLFTFAFEQPVSGTSKGKEREAETRVRIYESQLQGDLQAWHVSEGQVLTSNRPILTIEEPCTHPVQLNGLCAVCAKDLTQTDYLGADTSRATISMSHDNSDLTVSRAEAERLESETTKRLLRSKKLSLIVDLDQTVVHATVDPTVGEWIADPTNPNYTALRDVVKFKLGHDGSAVADDQEGWWYYIKHRPGLRQFLEQASQLYEMHVYTMGTRNYAEAVCRGLDPDGRFFGRRILSRDESGSLTQKSLTRLFPCGTDMVVVIDDRADVWEWSPNLLKVIPFDFYVGIGDINSAYLPKKSALEAHKPSTASTAISVTHEEGSSPESPPYESIASTPSSSSSEAGAASASNAEGDATRATEDTLRSQVAERPLLQAQAKKEAQHIKEAESGDQPEQLQSDSEPSSGALEEAVLKEDDRELERILQLLQTVHSKFFDLQQAGKVADVKHIIPSMKRKVLKNCNLLFSSVIPLGTDPARSEIWRLAESFGATCFHDLQPQLITHVVAARAGTVKVNAARAHPHILVVWTAWLLESMALWKKLDETPFLLGDEGSDGEAPQASHEHGEDRLGELSVGALVGETADDLVAEAYSDGGGKEADINWDDADAELDAFLMESDDESRPPTPTNLKRSRSETPLNEEEDDPAPAASPLLKRQRLAAARSSKLRESFVGSAQESYAPSNGTASDDDDFLDAMAADLAR